MLDEDWAIIEGILSECWQGGWTEATGPSYRLMIGGYAPEVVVAAIRKCAASGKWSGRPSVSAIIAAIEEDPGLPTWAEAEAIIFGAGGRVLRDGGVDAHPAVREFIEMMGPERLLMAPIHDPQWGEKERRELGDQYDAFIARRKERSVHAVATGQRGQLRRLEPLAALGVPESVRPALDAAVDGGGVS